MFKRNAQILLTSNFLKSFLVPLLSFNLFCNTFISLVLLICRLLFRRKGFVHKIKRWSIAKRELKFIKQRLSDGTLVSLNYDLKFAPSTYGDLFCFLMLSRYFFQKKINTKVYISNVLEHEKLISDFLPFISKIIPANDIIILPGKLEKPLNNSVEVFGESRGLNTTAHQHYFNLLNLLMAAETDRFCKNFLLKSSYFDSVDIENKIPSKYFVIHCRYIPPASKFYVLEKMRNTNETQFINLVKVISEIFPEKDIIILSDSFGTKFYKSISSKYGLNCFFPESEKKNFFSDAKIVLGSEWYFQLNGGGLCMIAWFSKINYVTFVKAAASEVQWNFNMLTSWATEQQVYRQISLNDEFFSYLKVNKLSIDKNV
tara:strand:+ start:975 stop:2090 length:1116 start_codon:yes stop_codon:yes gene_type:complete